MRGGGTDLWFKGGDLESKIAEIEALSQKQLAEIEASKKSNEELLERLKKAESERDATNAKLTQALAQVPPLLC